MLAGILFITLVTVFVNNAAAISEEEKAVIQAQLALFGTPCFLRHPLTADEVDAFKEKRFPGGENAACFLACLFRELGLIDEDGNYSYQDLLEQTKQQLNEDTQKNFEDLLHSCDEVNEVEVSDGDKGCERAKLAYICLVKNGPTYGFDLDV